MVCIINDFQLSNDENQWIKFHQIFSKNMTMHSKGLFKHLSGEDEEVETHFC